MHRFACYIFDNILLVSYYHYLYMYVYVYVYQASSYPTTHTLGCALNMSSPIACVPMIQSQLKYIVLATPVLESLQHLPIATL